MLAVAGAGIGASSPPPPRGAGALPLPINERIDEPLINFLVTILCGVWLVKHAQSRGFFAGAPARRWVWLDTTQDVLVLTWAKNGDGAAAAEAPELGVGAITAVRTGLSTDALRRSGTAAKEGLYFSLVAADRSLDFECASAAQREQLSDGFARIVAEPSLLQEGLIFVVKQGIWLPAAPEPQTSQARRTSSSPASPRR